MSLTKSLSQQNISTRFDDLLFRAKASLLQLRRGWQNWRGGQVKWPPQAQLTNSPICASSQTDLWVGATEAEWSLQAGKIHNLRLAIRHIDGIEIPAGEIFSFWSQVGQPTVWRGFAVGRELREGCIIPTVGGGLCQLSNALYDAALQSGLEIVERYAHSQVIPGSLAEIGRDATVFWNYIDLKFRASKDLRIEARMDDRHLIVEFKALSPQTAPSSFQSIPSTPASILPHNCLSCGVTSCFRSQLPDVSIQARTGYLVDDYWVEFDRYIQTVRTERDRLYLPIDGRRFHKHNYSWNTTGFERNSQQWGLVIRRAYRSRRLARQGAARQRVLIAQSRQLALNYGATLSPDTTHLVIAQSLLPWLWEAGYLGGRTFDVLLTTLPIEYLQERLDLACKSHPTSSTLGDFRASTEVSSLEMSALKRARKVITPHRDLANILPRTELIDWVMPTPLDLPKIVGGEQSPLENRHQTKPTLVLPCSSLGRKGIYELRSAMVGMDVNLIIVGSELEDGEFWAGYSVEYTQDYHYARQQASAIVLPAWVEHQPRRLLQAISEGIPIIASTACGLADMDRVDSIAIADITALREAILAAILPISAP